MLSVICPYNDRSILEKELQASLKTQRGVEYETILIDAKQYGFCSAAETLNYAGSKAKGDYLVFLHQDIFFENPNVLKQINDFCKKNEFGIAGIAGCVLENKKVITISNICHGKEHTRVSKDKIDTPQEVRSVDECLFVIPKKIFEKIKFSNIGKTWHLYGTDYALQCRKNGYKALVFPIGDIWHLSDGYSLNINYFDSIQKLAKLYQDQKVIVTIFGVWPTNLLILKIKSFYRKIRLILKGN